MAEVCCLYEHEALVEIETGESIEVGCRVRLTT